MFYHYSQMQLLYLCFRREERKKNQDALDSTLSQSRRPEVSLTIKVDDFR